jgi:hypothetical protein
MRGSGAFADELSHSMPCCSLFRLQLFFFHSSSSVGQKIRLFFFDFSPRARKANCGLTMTELIPQSKFFGNPDKSEPKISPDGKRYAYLASSQEKGVSVHE